MRGRNYKPHLLDYHYMSQIMNKWQPNYENTIGTLNFIPNIDCMCEQ